MCSRCFPIGNCKISASGCGNFKKMEEDLKVLKQLMATYLPQLFDRLLPLLCHYAFNECPGTFGDRKSSNIQAICSEISKLQLNDLLHLAPLLKDPISCLPIPTCRQNQSCGSNVSSCPTPLVPTQTKFAQKFGLYCSPPCFQPMWKLSATIFKITKYFSVTIHWIIYLMLK